MAMLKRDNNGVMKTVRPEIRRVNFPNLDSAEIPRIKKSAVTVANLPSRSRGRSVRKK